jgi:hypothetical protein
MLIQRVTIFFNRSSLSSQGGVLIGTVVAMVVMGALGAGMVSMLGTTIFNEVRANHGERAYYLSESGFRYAMSVYRHNDKQDFLDLDETTFDVDSGGNFKLLIEESNNSEGYDENFYITEASYWDPSTESIIVKDLTTNATIPKGSQSRLTLGPSGLNLPERGGLVDIDGEIDGQSIRYYEFDGTTIRGLSDDVILEKIVDPSNPADYNTGKLTPIAKVESTGSFPGSGWLSATRSVTYWWPMSGGGGAGDGEAIQPFDGEGYEYQVSPMTTSAWHTSNKKSSISSATYVNPQGGTYVRTDLRVIGYDSLKDGGQNIRYHYIPFKHNAAGLNFFQAWESNINLLSYDAQVKLTTGPNLDNASMGIMFRAKEEGNGNNKWYSGYGISIIRFDISGDYIPSSIKPTGQEGNILLLLWKQTGKTTWKWIAYKRLYSLSSTYNCWQTGSGFNCGGTSTWNTPSPFDGFVRGHQYTGDGHFIHDDTTIIFRIVESIVGGSRVNDIQVFFGDARWSSDNQNSRSQDNNAYNVEFNRFGYHHRFAPSGELLWKWPSTPNISSVNWIPTDNDWITGIQWDAVNTGILLKEDASGLYSIIRDSSYDSSGFTNNQQKNPEIVLHTFGNTTNVYFEPKAAPIHFQDFAVRLLKGSGSNPGGTFLPPIQQ